MLLLGKNMEIANSILNVILGLLGAILLVNRNETSSQIFGG